MTDDEQKEVARCLKSIMDVQTLIQGQVSALRVALAACFRVAQNNTELRTFVESQLRARLAVMKQDAQGLAESDGFESVLNELLGGTKSVHEPSGPRH